MDNFLLFAGNSNLSLSLKVAEYLGTKLGSANVGKFSDGEVFVEVSENVRGQDVFIIQSTSYHTDTHIMELLLLADALHRSSALQMTAVIPYMGYSRQDRRVRSERVPISARVFADMLSTVAVNRVLTVDLHADQIQGFFNVPVDNLYASKVLVEEMRQSNYDNLTVVSPDIGGVVRARAVTKKIQGAQFAIIDKRRSERNQVAEMHLIGDVKGRTCLLVDDLIDTGGTLCKAAAMLMDNGAEKVISFCTHPVLSGDALEKINASPLDTLLVTDTIDVGEKAKQCSKLKVLSLANLIGESIHRIRSQKSISKMFN